jgi:tRNA modification GTPase
LCCGEDAAAIRAAVAAVKAAGSAEAESRAIVLVRTKCDLVATPPAEIQALGARLEAQAAVEVSAETGAGVQQLLKTIGDVLDAEVGAPELDAPVLTQARHRVGIANALEELSQFRRAWREESLPATIAAVHLQAAAGALRDIIGGVDTEDVLDEVFRRFCVGK